MLARASSAATPISQKGSPTKNLDRGVGRQVQAVDGEAEPRVARIVIEHEPEPSQIHQLFPDRHSNIRRA